MKNTLMNVDDVAKYLGFSTKKIYRLVDSHKIPAIRVGRQYRFLKKAIDDWLKEMSTSSLKESKTTNISTTPRRKGNIQ